MKNKRNRIVNLFKTGVLLFGISLLLWNCEKEDEILDSSQPQFLIAHKNYSSVENNNSLVNILEKLSDTEVKRKSLFKEKIIRTNDFTIFTERVTYVKPMDNSRESYTFYIERNDYVKPNTVENVILSKKINEKDFKASIITYYFPNGIINNPNEVFEIVKYEQIDAKTVSNVFAKGCVNTYEYVVEEIEHDCYTGKHSGAGEEEECNYATNGGTPPYSTWSIHVKVTSQCDGGETGGLSGSGGLSEGGSTGTSTTGDNPDTTIDTGITLPSNCQTDNCSGEITANTINTLLGNTLNDAELIWLFNNDSEAQIIEAFLQNNYTLEAQAFAKGQIELETLIQDSKRNWKPSIGIIANNPNLQYTHSDSDADRAYFKMTDGSIIVTSGVEQTLTKSGDLTNKYRDTAGNSFGQFYYIKLPGQPFAEMLFNPNNLADELEDFFALAGLELGKSIGRYVLPIEDIKILIDGKDFDGQQVARWKAAGFLILAVVPGSKALKVVANASEAIAVAVKIGSNTLVVDTVKAGLKVVSDSNVIKFLSQTGDEIARVVDGVLTFNYRGFGGTIITNPNKTTTLIGRWPNQLENIWNTNLAKQGENLGGLNILGDVPSGTVIEKWNFNKQWLNQAISRGDNIRVTANPLDINNVFYNSSGISSRHFESISSLKSYLINLSELSDEVAQLGYYGREIRHLFQNGYYFDDLTKTFKK